jgi:hypothetical protein
MNTAENGIPYEKLVILAKENNLNLDIYSIDDFRRGVLSHCQKGKSQQEAAQMASDNLKKNPDHYSSFIDKMRRPKIFRMAIFDWALTILGILFVIAYFGLTGATAVAASVGIIATGVGVHKILGVDTQFGYYLGLNPRLR